MTQKYFSIKHAVRENWIVYKNNEILFISTKTTLQNVIDKLEREENTVYKIEKITDRFQKVELLDVVDPNGMLNIQIEDETGDIKSYLESRYGDVTVENEVIKIKSNNDQLVKRGLKKLNDEEYEALKQRILEEITEE